MRTVDAHVMTLLEILLRPAVVELLVVLVALTERSATCACSTGTTNDNCRRRRNTEVPEAVPLAATLGIELDGVVVLGARGLVDYPVPKRLAAVPGHLRLVEVPVEGDAGADLDLGGGSLDDLRGEEVEPAQLVVVPEQAPGVPGGAVFS